MNNKYLFTFLLFFTASCLPQSIDTLYEVAPWHGFRPSAISYTFDDNNPNQLAVAVPVFDEFGFKTSLFVITSTIKDWSGFQAAALNGHEIGSHSVSHASFGDIPDSLEIVELRDSKAVLDTYITGQKGFTIAYPFCVTGNKDLVKDYYFAARGCTGYIEERTPRDFWDISSLICGALGEVITEEDFKTNADDAVYYGGWCVYLLHGIDGDGGYSQLSSAVLRNSLQYLKDNQDKYWVAAFGEVVKYIRERNALSVNEISYSENSIVVSVSDTLDNFLFDRPVTIRRVFPDSWISASVTQNGKAVESSIVEIFSTRYVMFDAVPDNGDVIIFNGEPSSAGDPDISPESFSLFQNYPNPFNPSTTIKYRLPQREFVKLRIFDAMGSEISTLVNREQPAGVYQVEFGSLSLTSGVYIYRITAGSFNETRKMILMK